MFKVGQRVKVRADAGYSMPVFRNRRGKIIKEYHFVEVEMDEPMDLGRGSHVSHAKYLIPIPDLELETPDWEA